MSDIKNIKSKIANLKKSIKAAELRLELAETEDDRKKHEKTLKTFQTKLTNAKAELVAAKVQRKEELKEKVNNGVKSLTTKTGIAITSSFLIIAAGVAYFTLKGEEDEAAIPSDSV